MESRLNPYDPTQPQPGDWEAALSAIEAAEARADAVIRLRRWAVWGTAAAVATAVLWFAVRSQDTAASSLVSTAPTERTAEDLEATSLQPASELHTDQLPNAPKEAPSFNGDVAELQERSEMSPLPAESDASDAASMLALEAIPKESAEGESLSASLAAEFNGTTNAATGHFAEAVGRQAAEKSEGEQERNKLLSEKSIAVNSASPDTEKGMISLSPIGPNCCKPSVWAPSFEVISVSESSAQSQRTWEGLVSWEGGEWAALLTREVQGGWWVRLGGVWDGRHRKWVATPALDVFGALQAPRSVLSNQALWTSVGMECRQHIKGRWGAVGRLDAQYLIARHLVEGQWGGGEQIVAGGTSAWGQLKEESPWRIGWGAGCDWSVSEAHALRMTVGGFWSPAPTYDYMDWTEGIPRAAGELRLSWLWK